MRNTTNETITNIKKNFFLRIKPVCILHLRAFCSLFDMGVFSYYE